MLQRLHPEPELLRQANQRQELVGAVAVRRNEQLLVQDVENRLRPKVTAGWNPLAVGLPPLPLALVVPSGHEVVADDLLSSHAGIGVAPLTTLGVLAQCELHRPRRVLELEVLRQGTPPHLHEHVLAPDGVGGTVLHVSRRQSAGELTVHPDVVVRHHVPHLHLGNDGEATLVHPTDSRMDVDVDQSRGHVLARGVDLHCT